jgi:hypothetical protein
MVNVWLVMGSKGNLLVIFGHFFGHFSRLFESFILLLSNMKIMALRSLVIPYSQRHFATNKKKHTQTKWLHDFFNLIFKINELLLLCPLLGFEFPRYYWSLTNTYKSMKVGRKMQMNDERKLIFSIDNVVQKTQ